MADNTRKEPREQGLAYFVGWRREDFVGKTNPVTGKIITEFYPVFVLLGTRFMAGRDVRVGAMAAERPILRLQMGRALARAA